MRSRRLDLDLEPPLSFFCVVDLVLDAGFLIVDSTWGLAAADAGALKRGYPPEMVHLFQTCGVYIILHILCI